MLEIDPGFRTESAVAMEISLSDEPPQRRAGFYQQALERLAALPGVTAVGGVNGLPMVGGGADGQFLIDNNPALKGYGEFRVASPGYFNAMGMRLMRGRLFDQSDGPETPQVCAHQRIAGAPILAERRPARQRHPVRQHGRRHASAASGWCDQRCTRIWLGGKRPADGLRSLSPKAAPGLGFCHRRAHVRET